MASPTSMCGAANGNEMEWEWQQFQKRIFNMDF